MTVTCGFLPISGAEIWREAEACEWGTLAFGALRLCCESAAPADGQTLLAVGIAGLQSTSAFLPNYGHEDPKQQGKELCLEL